jgi:hypothetical protein
MQKIFLLTALVLFSFAPSAEARPDCPDQVYFGSPVQEIIDEYYDYTCLVYQEMPLPADAEETADEIYVWGIEWANYVACVPFSGLNGCTMPDIPGA